jgi:site-specific DNA-methyltransferase (adenine-specific)
MGYSENEEEERGIASYNSQILNKIICGNALSVLKTLPNESVNCCVTSPPYWGLRDYGVEGQLGLEKTFEEYITKLCNIFDEVERVLKKDGTCWVNLGDSYNGNKTGNTNGVYKDRIDKSKSWANSNSFKKLEQDIPIKSLCLIPQRFAIEMVNRGWILRNTIIWHKPNCMPSSAKDRFTVDFEHVYFFVKNKKYWFEQQFEEFISNDYDRNRMANARTEYGGKWAQDSGGSIKTQRAFVAGGSNGRNKRAVWTIPTKPFPEAHFAAYPEALIEPMIKAGCPKGGILLDPFMGAGTTAVVAKKQGRQYLGIEIKQEYIDMANKRIKKIPELLF